MTKSIVVACFAGAVLAAAGCGSSNANNDSGIPSGAGGKGGGSGAGGGGVDAGSTCPTAPYSHVSSFGAIFDGWGVAINSTPTLVPMPGVGVDGGFSGTVVELDPADGSPVNGSVKLTIPFTEFGQQMMFAQNYSPGLNMAGATITAQIKLDSGLLTGPMDIGRAYLVVKSTVQYVYAPAADIKLDPTAGWQTVTLTVDAPSPDVPPMHNPCDVREIDLVVETGQTGTYKTAVVHIDTISITRPGEVTP